jgi:2-aminoadipate transaminase
VAAEGPIREKLVLLKEASDLCQSNLTQAIAHRWFTTQPWLAQVEHFRDVYRRRCDVLLEEMRQEFPSSCEASARPAACSCGAASRGHRRGEMLAKAINARVAYVPGAAFYADATSGARELRLCFSSADEERIREGIRRLAKVLHAELELISAFSGSEEPR